MNQSNLNPEQRAKAEAIFLAATKLPSEEHQSFLDQQCATDPKLRAFVERLLTNDDEGMSGFLDIPDTNQDSPFSSPNIEGHWIDRYQLVRCIGRGGMGQVFLARQQEPQREVALKILGSDFLSPSLPRRFKLEIDVLGRLNHPGIAQIHDAGTTKEGHPYFAMEYVPGEPLTDFARSHDLTSAQRLELVLQICEAVNYANEKGVLHRDLKPANILVVDKGEGNYQVKILDFGVARLTREIEPDASVFTMPGQLLGTLAYMSPEQADGESREMDSRADVYQLGVILFELLSGKLPLDVEQSLLSVALRKIAEEEPPSLGSLDDTLKGDLEIIVAKAMAKEPQRRYEQAGELSADIRRFLSGQPIVARPTTAFYRMRKQIQRNRKTFLVLATVALVSVAAGWALFKGDTAPASHAPKMTMLAPNSGTKPVYTYPAISPDGTQMAVVKNPGHLFLKSVVGKNEKMLVQGVDMENVTVFAQWHPSGEKLLLTKSLKDGSYPLVWYDLSTGEQSVFLETDEFLQPVISPDGKSGIIRRDGFRELAILDLETGEIESLARAESSRQYHTPVWGPQGKRIACIEAVERVFHHLQCMDLQGNITTIRDDLLMKSSAFQSSMCWLPDGRLLFTREHDFAQTDSELWVVPMDDNSCQATGETQRLFSFPTWIVRDLTYSEKTNRLTFYTLRRENLIGLFEINSERGLNKVDLPQIGWPAAPMSFVNDGQHLVIKETRSANDTDVYLQNITTGQFQPLLVGPESVSPMAMTSDGQNLILFREFIREGTQLKEYELWAYSLADSQYIDLHYIDRDEDFAMWVTSPIRGGGSSYLFNQRGTDLVVREITMEEGVQPEMLALPVSTEESTHQRAVSVDISPDADRIAFVVNYEEVEIYDLASEETVAYPVDLGFVVGVRWPVEGNWVYIRGYVPTVLEYWIGRLDLETGAHEILWQSTVHGPNEMHIAPDGNHLSCQLRGGRSALGMLEGF